MEIIGASLLAFAIAAAFTALELITGQYPRTFFLISGCYQLWAYAVIYGLIAVAVVLLLPYLTSTTIEGIGLESPWVRAIAIGVSVKAFLHIRLFNVGTGPGQSFPVGVESIVQIFEPWLLRSIDLEHFNAIRQYVTRYANQYPDLEVVKGKIKGEIPTKFTPQEQAALHSDVGTADSTENAMEIYLTYVGRKTFERVFPLR